MSDIMCGICHCILAAPTHDCHRDRLMPKGRDILDRFREAIIAECVSIDADFTEHYRSVVCPGRGAK